MPTNTENAKAHGILLLDKPCGISSNRALQTARHLLAASKAGHTGSLDPLATGILPLCFGEATKFARFLLNADKHYWVQARLGIKTSTADSEGEIISQRPPHVFSNTVLTAAIDQFRGKIVQVPPMFSALKHKGQPLYKLARRAIYVERPIRRVHVYELTLLAYMQDTLTLELKCSKGTYVRTLIDDLGEKLACGAHVIALRRLGIAGYQANQLVSLEQLQALSLVERLRLLLPIDSSVQHYPSLPLSTATAHCLRQGQTISLLEVPAQGLVRLVQKTDGQFLGIGEILQDGQVVPRRLISL